MSWIFPRIVQVQGPITPGHCVTWIDENTIGDSGAPCGGSPPPTSHPTYFIYGF